MTAIQTRNDAEHLRAAPQPGRRSIRRQPAAWIFFPAREAKLPAGQQPPAELCDEQDWTRPRGAYDAG